MEPKSPDRRAETKEYRYEKKRGNLAYFVLRSTAASDIVGFTARDAILNEMQLQPEENSAALCAPALRQKWWLYTELTVIRVEARRSCRQTLKQIG